MTIVDGEVAERRFVARYCEDGHVTGVLGWSMPKQTRLSSQNVVAAFQD